MSLRDDNRPHRLQRERAHGKVIHVQANTPDDAQPNEHDFRWFIVVTLFFIISVALNLYIFQGVQLISSNLYPAKRAF